MAGVAKPKTAKAKIATTLTATAERPTRSLYSSFPFSAMVPSSREKIPLFVCKMLNRPCLVHLRIRLRLPKNREGIPDA